MRYAFVSDLHANQQAWEAVLRDIRAIGVDMIICMGDVVGYGPRPAEVLASVHKHVAVTLLGNHDAVVAGKLDPSCFNKDAQKVIAWTQSQLNEKATQFLGELPRRFERPGFVCVHGALKTPEFISYLSSEEEARESFALLAEPLLLVGHTHIPKIHVLSNSGSYLEYEPEDFQIEPGKQYIVNVGSVGFSRDADSRATYCIFDDENCELYWHRVAYDAEAFAADVREQLGESAQSNYILSLMSQQQLPEVREAVDFGSVSGVVPEQSQTEAESQRRRQQENGKRSSKSRVAKGKSSTERRAVTRSGNYKSARRRSRGSATRRNITPARAPSRSKPLIFAIVGLLLCAGLLTALLLPGKNKKAASMARADTGTAVASVAGDGTGNGPETAAAGELDALPATAGVTPTAALEAKPAQGGVRLDLRVRPHQDHPLANLAEFRISSGAEALPPSAAASDDGYYAKAARFPLAGNWQPVIFSFVPDSESVVECSLYSSSDFLLDKISLSGASDSIAAHGGFEAVETRNGSGDVTEVYVTSEDGEENCVLSGKNLGVRSEGAFEGQKCLAAAGGQTEPGVDCAPVRFSIRTSAGKRTTVTLYLRGAAL